MYNQTIVTVKPKAPNHSYSFGMKFSLPLSIKSKSEIRLKDAIATTIMLNPMPIGLEVNICGMLLPNKDAIIWIK